MQVLASTTVEGIFPPKHIYHRLWHFIKLAFIARNAVLDGLEGLICLIDNVLLFERSQEEHDKRLTAVLIRLEEAKSS